MRSVPTYYVDKERDIDRIPKKLTKCSSVRKPLNQHFDLAFTAQVELVTKKI
jgi:hypothetical protein